MAGARSSNMAAAPLGSLYALGVAGDLTDGQLLERFLSRDDAPASEAAFTALVDRHGTMVLAVCRRELGDLHDAYDAFQATFLVLVTRARSIRHRESVGGWLFGIARRVAARARMDGARRQRQLQRIGIGRPSGEEMPDDTLDLDTQPDYAPLIAEVNRLPERFRAPVVLHYFEGLSAEATAQRLGCARGTVLSRLSRARHRIKRRLEQQGVSYPVFIPAADPLLRWLPPEHVPAWLAQGTVKAAGSLTLAGAAIESVVPAAVARLSRHAARTMTVARTGAAAASVVLLALAGVSIALATTSHPVGGPQSSPAMERPKSTAENPPPARADRPARGEPVLVQGQVVDPDGKPVRGARIFVQIPDPTPGAEVAPRRLAGSGPDGRFRCTIERPVKAHAEEWMVRLVKPSPVVVFGAASPGYGPACVVVPSEKLTEAITFRLKQDNSPIEGRIVSLEGRPIPGLTVKVDGLLEFPREYQGESQRRGEIINHQDNGGYGLYPSPEGSMPSVHTDADGRFHLSGLGIDRAAFLVIEGRGIERSFALVATSAGPDFRPFALAASYCGARRVEGPRFTLAVAPGRVMEGVVRDRDTGQPLAGAYVNDWQGQTLRSDAQGRFRFEGLPRAGRDEISVWAPDQPYVECYTPTKSAAGLEPIHVTVSLKRGVWIEGRVVDRKTGKPLNAVLAYYPHRDNPHLNDYPGALFLKPSLPHLPVIPTDADGRFRVAVPPGRALLAVKITEFGYQAGPPLNGKTTDGYINPLGFAGDLTTQNAFIPIDVAEGKGLKVPDIALEAGRTHRLRLVDPAGQPVTGARVHCLQSGFSHGELIPGDELPFVHANPGKAETLIFVHSDRSLGATLALEGDEPESIRVVLQPTATISGRLLHDDGKPRPGVSLTISVKWLHRGEEIHGGMDDKTITDHNGRFRIEHLVPGLPYTIDVAASSAPDAAGLDEGHLKTSGLILKPGETQDWGDVHVSANQP